MGLLVKSHGSAPCGCRYARAVRSAGRSRCASKENAHEAECVRGIESAPAPVSPTEEELAAAKAWQAAR